MCFADTIRRNIDQGRLTGAVFIDPHKAFETVNNEVLLSKLQGLGVMHREHEWFRNYLHNRTQVVGFQCVSSTAEPVSVGVLQGSILGLLLFVLHLNDLPSAVVECNVLMYVDDTVLFSSAPEVSTIEATLVRELRTIECWLRLNSLLISVRQRQCFLGHRRGLLR